MPLAVFTSSGETKVVIDAWYALLSKKFAQESRKVKTQRTK